MIFGENGPIRHGRACPGHPRDHTRSWERRGPAVLFLDPSVHVDGRVKPGHDGKVHAVPRTPRSPPPWPSPRQAREGKRASSCERLRRDHAERGSGLPPLSPRPSETRTSVLHDPRNLSVMAGLAPAIHATTHGHGRGADPAVLFLDPSVHVDGRVKPGHDGKVHAVPQTPRSPPPWPSPRQAREGKRASSCKMTSTRPRRKRFGSPSSLASSERNAHVCPPRSTQPVRHGRACPGHPRDHTRSWERRGPGRALPRSRRPRGWPGQARP